jgi:hypothetical protein
VLGCDNGGGYLAKFGVLLGVQLFVVQIYVGASLLKFPRRKLVDPSSVDFTIHIQFLLGGSFRHDHVHPFCLFVVAKFRMHNTHKRHVYSLPYTTSYAHLTYECLQKKIE